MPEMPLGGAYGNKIAERGKCPMASIKRIEGKDGASYKITVSMGRDARGKQIRRYMTWKPELGLTARQVEKRVKQVAVEFEKQLDYGFQADSRLTFAEYSQYVIDLKLENGGSVGASCASQYWRKKVLPYLGDKKIRDIRPPHIRETYREISQNGIDPMQNNASPIADFREIAKQYGSLAQFGEIAEIAPATVRKLCKGETVRQKTAVKVADAVGRPITDLFEIEDRTGVQLSAVTMKEIHSFVKAVFTQAKLDMIITINPAERVALPTKTADAKRTYFQPEEIAGILSAADTEPIRWKTMVYMLAMSGMRRGELLALKWSDVDFERKQIEVNSSLTYYSKHGKSLGPTKTRRTRWVPLPDEMFRMLKKYKLWQMEKRLLWGDQWEETDIVFTTDRGGAIYPNDLNRWLNAFSKRHNLPHINPHAFRHTAASIMISRGVDVVSVSQMLGHSNTTTTLDVYAHAIEETKRNAAECIADTILRRQA